MLHFIKEIFNSRAKHVPSHESTTTSRDWGRGECFIFSLLFLPGSRQEVSLLAVRWTGDTSVAPPVARSWCPVSGGFAKQAVACVKFDNQTFNKF